MKTLELNQMEKLQGGKVFSDCADSAISLGLTLAGAFLVTGPIGAGLFAASFIWGSVDLAGSCK
ncbi:hypothetical protein ORI89_09425 [Sphingobacterium sp. UT-1RO-CII-1]|uniref:hypothetical protein n=1 Tax=Sphingobacterium sp. UT-1RO-CII-1 TaxID=2995225 RepID=UPI00227CCB7A|nr:hypothetical protein [Sphingobacterium sp. UT-1RO-CII-1]MCY4779871.1 hypothetical protein [Sphingobacterium sp. UT-1RO-CII-1]